MSEVSDFVPTMLLMGSKFQIDSFMMLFEIVEEALRKQQGNENAHDKFKKCLELKIPDFLSRLVSKAFARNTELFTVFSDTLKKCILQKKIRSKNGGWLNQRK